MSGDKAQLDFLEDKCNPLVQLDSSESTEFWLIQWPHKQDLDFDGQEVSLQLHNEGSLGNFTGTSGKEYQVVSFKSLDTDATVFVSSASQSKVVGKISRRVSFVHYPEPSELSVYDPNKVNEERQRASFERSLQSVITHNGPSVSRSTIVTTKNGWSNQTDSSRTSSKQQSGVPQANIPPKSSRKRKSSGSSDSKSSEVKNEQD